jgi:hypothetical protein
MEHSYDDDIDDDLNRFCEDMESELKEISAPALERTEDFLGLESNNDNGNRNRNRRVEKEKEQHRAPEKETTVAASPWGMSLFSSFASSATKSLAASFSPLAKDMSSISSLATTATRAFSDTLSGAPVAVYSTPEQKQKQRQQQGGGGGGSGQEGLAALAQTPETLEKLRRIVSAGCK